MESRSDNPAHTIVIGSSEKWWHLPWREAWESRGLFSFFLWKDVRVRYKQTFMGLLWAMLQPVMEMIVFTLVFGEIYAQSVTNVPYYLFVYAGLLPWTYIATTVSSSTQSLVANADIIKRIYFPRFLLPVAVAVTKMIDFGVALVIMIILMAFEGVPIGMPLLAVPLACPLLLLAAIGASFWLSALNALYRDVGLILPYFLRLSMFLTPVVYPLGSLSPTVQTILWINPLTSAVELSRAALLPQQLVQWNLVAIGTLLCVALTVSGFLFFRRMESRILDTL